MGTGENASEVRVEVVGVFEEQSALSEGGRSQPLLALRDGAQREIHIPVSYCEGIAVQLAFEQRVLRRPLTHDLAVNLIEKFTASLAKVVVAELPDGIVYATLHLNSSEGETMIEARPGDAVAVALRSESPVYVTEEVMARAERRGQDI